MLSSRLVEARPVRTVASLWRKSSITFSILLLVSLLTSLTILSSNAASRVVRGEAFIFHFKFVICHLSLPGRPAVQAVTNGKHEINNTLNSTGRLPVKTSGDDKWNTENGKWKISINLCLIAYFALDPAYALTIEPTRSPVTARLMLPGSVISKTRIGKLLSLQSEIAEASITASSSCKTLM